MLIFLYSTSSVWKGCRENYLDVIVFEYCIVLSVSLQQGRAAPAHVGAFDSQPHIVMVRPGGRENSTVFCKAGMG